jgi:zinc transporter
MLNPPESYGADASGLICAYQFARTPLRDRFPARKHCIVFSMTNRTGFVWLHLNLSHVATEKWLREHLVAGRVL